jgi:hypothetical protein
MALATKRLRPGTRTDAEGKERAMVDRNIYEVIRPYCRFFMVIRGRPHVLKAAETRRVRP